MKPSCTDRLGTVSVDLSPLLATRPSHARTRSERAFSAGALWGFDAKPGARVSCVDGSIWVTQTGDGADHVLGEGESLTVDLRGRVVIQALADARVVVE
jgi:hypothetical protein